MVKQEAEDKIQQKFYVSMSEQKEAETYAP